MSVSCPVQAMEEVHKLRSQISAIVQTNFTSVDASFIPNLQPPRDVQVRSLSRAFSPSSDLDTAQSHSSTTVCGIHRPSCNQSRPPEAVYCWSPVFVFQRYTIQSYGYSRRCFCSPVFCPLQRVPTRIRCFHRGCPYISGMDQRCALVFSKTFLC